jgi:hypothetical protein
MIIFLLLVIAAIALGAVGVVVKGLFYLLFTRLAEVPLPSHGRELPSIVRR